jgi:hypothetical protein
MTDNQYVIRIKEEAIEFLLETTFSHVHQLMHEAYIGLTKENCILQQRNNRSFHFDGVYYPTQYDELTSNVPSLHVTLISRLYEINNFLVDRHYHYVKNYFSAVISNSYNEIVLNEMLPTTLLNALKTEISKPGFKILDCGYYGSSYREPIALTLENLAQLKDHYSETLKKLQSTLMEKLLLT